MPHPPVGIIASFPHSGHMNFSIPSDNFSSTSSLILSFLFSLGFSFKSIPLLLHPSRYIVIPF